MTQEATSEHGKSQAKAQLESVCEMVAALECDYDRLNELREMNDGTGPTENDGDNLEEFTELNNAAGDCEDEDEARQRITDDALSVDVRSDWESAGSELKAGEYRILLCTGGPAVQITGDLNQYGEPDSAKLQYQDWFTPWTDYHDTTSEQDEALLTYARQFYFGE